jgi:uncharacterized protein (TIRG00374 family)
MNLKKILITLIQAAVTCGLLWWIFHDPVKRHEMIEALEEADPRWLVPGFLCFGLVLVCSAFRWQLLMDVQGIHLTWYRVWQLVMVGMFYNLFLPGGTGGDLVKIFYAVKEAPKLKSAVFLSIVVDRITGLFALILVSTGVFFFFQATLMSSPLVRAFSAAVGIIFGGITALILIAIVIDRFHLANRLPEKLPGHAFIIETARAFSVYARSWKAVLAAILISLPLNLFLFGAAIFSAFAFKGNPGAAAMTSVIPIVTTISSLPISLAGVGVREKLFATMLHSLYGTPENLGVLISITGFALIVLWGLIGGIVNLFYRPADGSHASIDEIEHQIESIEHQVEAEERAS